MPACMCCMHVLHICARVQVLHACTACIRYCVHVCMRACVHALALCVRACMHECVGGSACLCASLPGVPAHVACSLLVWWILDPGVLLMDPGMVLMDPGSWSGVDGSWTPGYCCPCNLVLLRWAVACRVCLHCITCPPPPHIPPPPAPARLALENALKYGWRFNPLRFWRLTWGNSNAALALCYPVMLLLALLSLAVELIAERLLGKEMQVTFVYVC